MISNNFRKWSLAATALLAPVAFIGCGGGGNDFVPKTRPPVTPVPTVTATPVNVDPNIANAVFIALQASGTSVVTFNGSSANGAVTRPITGLPGGVTLRGIDARVAPGSNGRNGSNGIRTIYALGNDNVVYTLSFAGTTTVAATPVSGTPLAFDGFTLGNGAYGFDFNPAADRLRVVSGTQNSRANPNNGTAVDGDANTAGTQPDGTLRYSRGDVYFGQTPNITAAGYTNNVPDTPSTVNYGIDSARGVLVTQGSPNSTFDDNQDGVPDGAVSPNTGTLFTIGALGAAFAGNTDVGLEVFGSSNTAVAVSGRTFYQVNLATGAATAIGTINSDQDVIDVTVAL